MINSNPTAFSRLEIGAEEFHRIRDFLYAETGINLDSSKTAMVCARLTKRLRHHRINSFGEYLSFTQQAANDKERVVMVDLLSTNETYFFREPGHFDFLRNNILPDHPVGGPMRVWSAASSSGEEAYSIAMLLGDVLGKSSWEIFGSDISTRVLEKARRALYPLARHEGIPEGYLKRFCLRGKGPHEGSFLINTELRDRVRFAQINLNKSLPELGEFNVIFLRNVLIYFDFETKQKIINRLGSVLSPGGYLFIGHTENLHGVVSSLKTHAPAIYRKN